MTETIERASLRGVAAAKPKRGKGSAVLIRVTKDTRDALEEEVRRTGRSLSQTAEIWLDEARKGRASYDALLGGTQLASAIEKLLALARDVEARTDPEVRHDTLVAAWTSALPWVIPRPSVSDSAIRFQTYLGDLWSKCDALLASIDKLPPDDPVRLRLNLPVDPNRGGSTIRDEILRVNGGEWQISSALELLSGAGSAVDAEISAVNLAIISLEIVIEENEKRLSEARNLGRAIAAAHGFDHRVAFQGLDPA